jgi:hypothetical protein
MTATGTPSPCRDALWRSSVCRMAVRAGRCGSAVDGTEAIYSTGRRGPPVETRQGPDEFVVNVAVLVGEGIPSRGSSSTAGALPISRDRSPRTRPHHEGSPGGGLGVGRRAARRAWAARTRPPPVHSEHRWGTGPLSPRPTSVQRPELDRLLDDRGGQPGVFRLRPSQLADLPSVATTARPQHLQRRACTVLGGLAQRHARRAIHPGPRRGLPAGQLPGDDPQTDLVRASARPTRTALRGAEA